MFRLFLILTVWFNHSVFAQDQSEQRVQGDLIRLVSALDEPEFYCFDLVGWGNSLQLDNPLQVHTCKVRNAADQMFALEGDQIRVAEYDRCLEVAGTSGVTLSGSAVIARACSDSLMQKIALSDEGKLQLSNTSFCLVAGGESAEASGPSHLWRTLSIVNCNSVSAELSTWQVGLK